MLTSKRKAILFEFIVELLVKGIIGYKYPDNYIKKSLVKSIFGGYLAKHCVTELFQSLHLSAILVECRLILPLENSPRDDATIYKFSNERLKDLIRKFSKVGKFYSLKGLINPEPSELYVHHCVTFSAFAFSAGSEERRNCRCIICEKSFKTPREYEDHMRFHAKSNAPKDAKILSQSFKVSIIEITLKDIMLEITNTLDVYQSIQKIELISPSYENIKISQKFSTIGLDGNKRVVYQIPRNLFQDIFEVIGMWKIVFKFSNRNIGSGTEIYDLVTYERNEYLKKIQREEKGKFHAELKLYKTLQHYPTFEMEALFKKDFAPSIESNLQERTLHRKLEDYMNAEATGRLHQSNYVEVMSHSLQIEELTVSKEVEKYNKNDQRLQYRSHGCYTLNIEKVSEMRPSILPNDRICLINQYEYNRLVAPNETAKKIFGRIVRIENDCIVVRVRGRISPNDRFHVSFEPNRNNFRIEAHALHLLKNSPKLQKILFPLEPPIPKNTPPAKEPIWFNKCVANNEEQKWAIMHIVAGTAYPCPYIIFGPPGTGKTLTVVEAVCQLWKQQPNSHVLVTAQSNAACDEITTRLLRYLPNTGILRMFSKVKEREIPTMDPELVKVANMREDGLFYPSLKMIYQFRIVVCTISMAGKLVQARINTKHFSHVFIDESGCCTESQTIVPIIGIVANEHNIHGQIILAGDHKQLGPVLTSSMAKRRGYSISMMERLIQCSAYERKTATSKYNVNLASKLLHNYRSCPPILDVSNIMFYDNQLIANAQNNWALNWKFLPNKKIPIAFDPIMGNCEQDSDSPSFYNSIEIDAVMGILTEILTNGVNSRKITESEVGIIAPYKKQMTKIRDMCTARGWEGIDVASVELFQGREKEVIILTTVRSQKRSLGFLSDPKRLNVALTRAKGLLIIVGNPETLSYDKNWKFVIDLYGTYGLISSVSKNIQFSRNFDTSLTSMINHFKRISL
ncbi:putative helicase mov-10-B.1 [Lutzomyia longipalpis]|uniref:putative helicase mov-10-B.1 n=1 Tax=Lutzomyia longipalpis TaxID=7200 RepID=UPI002483B1ED|nr:putative helicase mov-10-B.1 [Lutzomyia longipalpis]